MSLQLGCWPGLWSMEDSPGGRGSDSSVANTHDSRVTVDCWQEASVSHRMDLSQSCLSVLIHGSWLSPEWVISERARWKPQCLLWPRLRSYTVISAQLFWLHKPAGHLYLFIIGKAHAKEDTRRQESSWRLDTIPPVQPFLISPRNQNCFLSLSSRSSMSNSQLAGHMPCLFGLC